MITTLLAVALVNCAAIIASEIMRHRDLVGRGAWWRRSIAAATYTLTIAFFGVALVVATALVEHITDRSPQ